jgi:CBS domain-containing protein
VICPTCGHDNIEGVDACENCGTDLRTVDLPEPGTPFEARMEAHLSSLRPHRPEVVAPDTLASTAIARMREAGTDCVLVGDGDRLRGIFTERDAVLKLAGRPLGGQRVAESMTVDPVILREEDTVAVAIHKMALGGFRHIPVVDDRGAPVGVVTAADLFRHILAAS